MTEPSVSFAGNLTDDPELRHTESGIARAMFRVVVSGRREQEASFFTVIVWRDQAEHASQSLSKGSRVVVVGRLQQRGWTAEDGSVRSTSVPSCLRYRASLMGPLARRLTGHSARPVGAFRCPRVAWPTDQLQGTRPVRRRVRPATEAPTQIIAGRSFSTNSRPALRPAVPGASWVGTSRGL